MIKTFIRNPVVIFILKLVVTIALLIALFFYINVQEIILSLSQANIALLAVGFVLVLANNGIHFLRWRYLLRLIADDISNADVISSLLVGFTAGFFTPGQIGEVVGRIASHPDLKKSHIVGLTIIDKLYILSATVITGVGALIFFLSAFYSSVWSSAYSVVIILLLCSMTMLFLFPERSRSILTLLPERVRVHKLYSVMDIIENRFKNKDGRIILMLSTLLYVIIAIQFYVFLNAFESVTLFDSAIGSLSVYFIKAVILPISIGDLGVRESAAVFFFSKFGVSAASAFNASICMFLSNIVVPSAVGALLVLQLKIK